MVACKAIVYLTKWSPALSHLIGFYEPVCDVLLAGSSDEETAFFISMMERVIAFKEIELKREDHS